MTNRLEMYRVRARGKIARIVLIHTRESAAIGHTVVAAGLPSTGRVAKWRSREYTDGYSVSGSAARRARRNVKMNAGYIPFKVTAETLCGVEMFAGLDTACRESIANRCEGRRFRSKQQILSQADNDCEAFFIISGSVKIGVYSDSGKEIIFRELGAGQIFGELSAIDARQRSAHVHALEDTAVVVLSSKDFRKVTSEHPVVAGRVMQFLCGLVRALSIRVFEHDALSVNSRVHAELLRLAQEHMVSSNRAEISPTPTHVEFAAHIGTHREAVTKELNKMRKMGLLQRMGRTLVVNDVSAIEHLAKGDHGINPGSKSSLLVNHRP